MLKTELRAGLVTFLTMSYILVVNPTILAAAGMPYGPVFTATCVVTILGCLLVGLLADLPFAIAPAMGMNVYFSYVIVGAQGFSWQAALGAVCLGGLGFLFLSLFRLRQKFIASIPQSIAFGTASGIGLFIALVALKSAGLIIASPNTLITLGNLHQAPQYLCLIGILAIVVLHHFRIASAMIITILGLTLIAFLLGKTQFHGIVSLPPSILPVLGHLQFNFSQAGWIVAFTFLLIALFDSTGTFLGLLQTLDIPEKKTEKIGRALLAESLATTAAGIIGTSGTSPFIESATGIAAGGHRGLTAIFIAGFFVLALFFAPLATMVPYFATAPALLFVACLMLKHMKDIPWNDLSEAIPAALIILMIPLSFSIADGIGLGFISYTFIQIFTRQWQKLNLSLIIVTAVFLLYFFWK